MILSRRAAATAGAILLSTTAAMAEHDGFYNVSYNDIGFSLTQIGGHGELIVEPQGFGKMGFGRCIVNFSRDENGAVKDMSPVAQQNSATCPESLVFSVAPGEKGMYKITFTEGGPLAGKDFDLFPVLQPMREEFRPVAPKGFDVLGLTIGQTRAEVEAALTEKGFARHEGGSSKAEYTSGASRSYDLWTKGTDPNTDRPEDNISLTYTTVIPGDDAPERVALLSRQWNVQPEAKLSMVNLNKSLEEKHGKTTSGFDARIYDRAGELVPKAFQPVCDPAIHLQAVSLDYRAIAMQNSEQLSTACGAKVDIMTIESFETPGAAGMLKVTLVKGDVAYEDFWKTWSAAEEKELAERFELQSGMTGSAPAL